MGVGKRCIKKHNVVFVTRAKPRSDGRRRFKELGRLVDRTRPHAREGATFSSRHTHLVIFSTRKLIREIIGTKRLTKTER